MSKSVLSLRTVTAIFEHLRADCRWHRCILRTLGSMEDRGSVST